MHRAASILLLAAFLLIGTGAAAYLHDLQHAAEDARLAGHSKPAPVHDDDNCVIHALLHAPLLLTHWSPLLIGLGLVVAVLTHLAPRLLPQQGLRRVDCRGPPLR